MKIYKWSNFYRKPIYRYAIKYTSGQKKKSTICINIIDTVDFFNKKDCINITRKVDSSSVTV